MTVLLVGFIFVLVADAVSIMSAYWAWIIGRETMSASREPMLAMPVLGRELAFCVTHELLPVA